MKTPSQIMDLSSIDEESCKWERKSEEIVTAFVRLKQFVLNLEVGDVVQYHGGIFRVSDLGDERFGIEIRGDFSKEDPCGEKLNGFTPQEEIDQIEAEVEEIKDTILSLEI